MKKIDKKIPLSFQKMIGKSTDNIKKTVNREISLIPRVNIITQRFYKCISQL